MASGKPKNLQMPNSVEAARTYSQQMRESPAERYVNSRGLEDAIERFALGYVGTAITGHESYRGRLAIPFLRPAGGSYSVATIRFRCIADECVKDAEGNYLHLSGQKESHACRAKYKSLPGDPPRIYNTRALLGTSRFIGISEGEIDAETAELDGIPTVGVPGVGSWRDHWDSAFLGYERVFIFGDGDDPGREFSAKLAARIPNAVPVAIPDGLDLNALRLLHGPGSIRAAAGIN